ncbi:hypothetical protein [Tsukamurella sp. USMM236]|uniref:hypothetical protein n=1 Tax=Tsukamurella sp. USMM236 TaxID=3081301 RepID=UPI003015C619
MGTLFLMPLIVLAVLVPAIVVAMRDRALSAGDPFSRASAAVQWSDRAPLLAAIVLVVVFWLSPTTDGPGLTAGSVLVLLAVDVIGQRVRARGVHARTALAGPRRIPDMVPRALLAVSGLVLVLAVAALIVVAGSVTPGPTPCDRLRDEAFPGMTAQARSGDGNPMSPTVAWAWLVVIVGAAVLVALAIAAADRRPPAAPDPAVDHELRIRAMTRAVAVLGFAAASALASATAALVRLYPARFEKCFASDGFRWDPSVWPGLAATASAAVVVGVLVFSAYRFVAPSRRWRP